MVDLDDEVLAAGLVPVVHPVDAADLPWHAGRIEQRGDLVDIPLRQQRVDPFGESDPVDDALGVGREALLGRVHPERRGELDPQSLGAAGDLDHPALAVEQAVWRDRRVMVALGARHLLATV